MGEPPNCSCGIPATVKISWTAKNPGKKFYGCAYYEHNNGGGDCGYFKWHETSDYERCDKLVRHARKLTKKVKDLETDVEKRKLKERIMNLMLFMDIIAVIYQWLWKSNLDEIDMPNAAMTSTLCVKVASPKAEQFLNLFNAASEPSGNTPLYTFPYPPFPIMFSLEKFLVAALNLSSVNLTKLVLPLIESNLEAAVPEPEFAWLNFHLSLAFIFLFLP